MARRQLYAAGVTKAEVESRVRTGWLRRVRRAVYAVGYEDKGGQREVEALLACHGAAVLSHLTAARLWQIHQPAGGGAVDIMVRDNAMRPQARLRVHRSRELHRLTPAYIRDLPVTPAALTLVQIAPWLTVWELERAIDEALARRLVAIDELARTASDHRHRRGAATLRELIRTRIDGAGVSKRGVELELLKLIRECALPEPQRNVQLGTFSVDFYWPEVRVAVEAQSYTWHTVRTNYERDNRKESALKRAGIDLTPLTWDAVTRRRLETAVLLAKLLAGATWPTT